MPLHFWDTSQFYTLNAAPAQRPREALPDRETPYGSPHPNRDTCPRCEEGSVIRRSRCKCGGVKPRSPRFDPWNEE